MVVGGDLWGCTGGIDRACWVSSSFPVIRISGWEKTPSGKVFSGHG